MGVEEGDDDGRKGDGDGNGDKEGNGNQPQQTSDNGDNGNGEGDGTKDMTAHTMPLERGGMVAMGHGLCVSFRV